MKPLVNMLLSRFHGLIESKIINYFFSYFSKVMVICDQLTNKR